MEVLARCHLGPNNVGPWLAGRAAVLMPHEGVRAHSGHLSKHQGKAVGDASSSGSGAAATSALTHGQWPAATNTRSFIPITLGDLVSPADGLKAAWAH